MSLTRAATIALVACLATLGVASPSPANRKGETHKVTAEGSFGTFNFDPSDLEIEAGDKVVWTNNTGSEHHITPYEGPWPEDTHLHLEADTGKASFRFKKPGVYKYYCDIRFHGQLLPGGVCLGQCASITVS